MSARRYPARNSHSSRQRTIGGQIDYARLMPKPEDMPTLPFDSASATKPKPKCPNTGVPAQFCTCAGPHE